jgi:NAD-dependent deacetylase
MSEFNDGLEIAARILAEAGPLVVSTGAGISKESGIPTFRDAPNALWEKYEPERLASPEGFRQDPPLVWRWYVDRREMIGKAKPNPGHYAIAELEDHFDQFLLVTQNIDDLHRKAGSRNLVEVHGNIFRYKCFDAGHPIETLPKTKEIPPKCECGSLIRPDVVWFGEMLPEDAVMRAYAATESCAVMLVVGTSGIVYPVAGFPGVAKRAGAKVIEVNPETTAITHDTDISLRGPSGDVLPQLLKRFLELRKEVR